MNNGEDLFVFLNRFEYGMKSNSVPPCDWVHILLKLLHGIYKETYFNCISDTSYQRMRTVLLNVGGYSLNDCLAFKFRQSGSKSVMQFYNNWKYKYSVTCMLSQPSFLDVFTEDQLDLICQGVAALGIVAGMPFEARKSVLDRQHNSPQAFIEDCASSVTSADGAPRSFHSNNDHFHSSRHAYHSHNHRPPVSNHGSNNHHPNSYQRPGPIIPHPQPIIIIISNLIIKPIPTINTNLITNINPNTILNLIIIILRPTTPQVLLCIVSSICTILAYLKLGADATLRANAARLTTP